jgi:DNA polymerase IV
VTRSRSFSAVIARHDLLRRASIELVRTVLPTNKGIRLLGVTVSNFEELPAVVADELPLFADEAASAHRLDTTPVAEATGGP